MLSFVVLHYKNIEDTIECLQNLSMISKGSAASFIVVDNNTLNKKEENRIKKYTQDVLKLDKNYGFAQGNNKGISYAKEKYNPDFICVINNDVFIKQSDFINKVVEDYKKYRFDILGTRIDSPTGESVNPFPVFKSKQEIELEIEKCKKLAKIYSSTCLTLALDLYIKLKHLFRKPSIPKNGERVETDVALHGCAIIFSKKYLKKYDDAFYKETFLFHEEEFLYHRTRKDKLISIYDPEIIIFHKEGSSIKNNRNKRESNLFRCKERLKSLNLLLKELDN